MVLGATVGACSPKCHLRWPRTNFSQCLCPENLLNSLFTPNHFSANNMMSQFFAGLPLNTVNIIHFLFVRPISQESFP